MSDLKIMMIDDNEAANLYHRIMIEDAGINPSGVTEFKDSEKAIAHLIQLKEENKLEDIPDVLLIDINMPCKSGWQVVEEIEALNLGVDTPDIYMVSNSQHPLDIKKAKENKLIKALKEKHLEKDFFLSLVNS